MEIKIGEKKIIGYKLPGLFFKKYWFWFDDPVDVSGADMVNFFSYNDREVSGFRKKKGLTTIIDLKQTLDVIHANFRKNFICKQVERGERNGIIVKQDNNFSEFKDVYYRFRRERNLHGDRFKVFQQNGVEFSAYYRDKMIAGGIFIAGNKCFRAWVLASLRLDGLNGQMRDIVGQANRMVIWEAIKFAKSNGYEIFDLGGIDPDSPDPQARSLAEFKEAFGGRRRMGYYYIKTYSKLLGFLANLKRKF